ncbi:MAG: hypothetical protein GKR89_31525 [Candidatus Latescibacteria bacterium]|nr:hypothetical protein [Candidatus Latescibacterota bacterium]
MTAADALHALGPLLVDLSFKATLLLGALLLLDRFGARHRAAWRSLLWKGGTIGLLVLPLAPALLPPLHLGTPSQLGQQLAAQVGVETVTTAPLDTSPIITAVSPPRKFLGPTAPSSWPLLVAVLYLAGLTVFLVRLTGGWYYLTLLRNRRAWPSGLQHRLRLRRLQGQLGLRRPVRLLASAQVQGPVQIGALDPAIILPAHLLGTIDEATFDAVVAHELAHVRRWDFLFNLLSSLTLALYWFHPLAWIGAQRLRTTGEEACDDWGADVLGDAKAYARHLLDVAAGIQQQRWSSLALPLAGQTGTLHRVRRLAAGHTPRPRLPRLAGTAWILALGAGAVCLGRAEVGAAPSQPAQQNNGWLTALLSEHWQNLWQGESAEDHLRALAGPNDQVRQRAAYALLRLGPQVVPRLIEESRSEFIRVRYLAVQLLGRMKDPSAVPALILRLDDSSAHVAGKAAWSLGQLRAVSALPALLDQVNDISLLVRPAVLQALGACHSYQQYPDLSAQSHAAVLAALDEPEVEIQMAAVQSARYFDYRGATAQLLHLATTGQPRVRHLAIQALGELVTGRTPGTTPKLPQSQRDQIIATLQQALIGEQDYPTIRNKAMRALQLLKLAQRRAQSESIYA